MPENALVTRATDQCVGATWVKGSLMHSVPLGMARVNSQLQ